ncbi:MAG: hypothetical protein LBS39_01310, partial [Campylobacteraceae bacterium]|nr:hypothetical protein [Campylobacteraceae bacterium]
MVSLCLNLIFGFTKLVLNIFNNFKQKYYKKIIGAVFAFLALGAYANAAEAIDCSYVYGITNDGTGSRVYRYNDISSSSGVTDTGIVFNTYNTDGASTLAIGYAPNGTSGVTNELRVYRWRYHEWLTSQNTANARPSYFVSNSSASRTFVNYSGSLPAKEAAGGEVNQFTGEIYISSGWADEVSSNLSISVINPATQTASNVSFHPADASEPNLTTAISDMIIDANGDSFIIAGEGNVSITNRTYIARLDMSTGAYYAVKKITLPFNDNITAKDFLSAGGLALLDGKIYVHKTTAIYVIDPVTGVSQKINGNSAYDFTDLGSCQLVPLIGGEIYNDANGNGQLDPGEGGIEGITVQLYDQNKNFLGEQTTTATGSYSFIVNDISNAEFYVRVKNPRVNGYPAAQTYASGGDYIRSSGTNTVTNYCTDYTNDDTTGSNTNRACYGARANGIDSSANDLNNANYYSKITMNTDKVVVHADFAFNSAYDKSDASSNYSEVTLNIGIKGSDGKPAVYLGNGVSEDNGSKADDNASGDDFDDGVFVMINGTETPLQNAVLLRGKTYTFKVYANGTKKDESCIVPFIALNNNGDTLPNSFLHINGTNAGCYNAASAAAGLTYTIPSVSQDTGSTFFRTIITAKRPGATFDSIDADGAAVPSSEAPWILKGEVEDYKVLITQRQLRLNVRSINDVGNFTFIILNTESISPSVMSRTIQTVTQNVSVAQPYDGTIHAINDENTDVAILGAVIPSQFGMVTSETKCVDLSYGSSGNLSITFNADDITIPGSAVKADSDIVCDIVYDVLPTIEFSANITNRIHANDNFNITIKDVNNSNATIASAQTSSAANASTGIIQVVSGNEYLFDEIMASGSVNTFGHYTKDINCTNNGTAITTNGSIPFSITPVWNDKIKCEITNSALNANLTSSEITVEPQTQEAGNSSTITVTLKDSLGSIINAGGDNVTIFI